WEARECDTRELDQWRVRIELIARVPPPHLDLHPRSGLGCNRLERLPNHARATRGAFGHQAAHLALELGLGGDRATHATASDRADVRRRRLVQSAPLQA